MRSCWKKETFIFEGFRKRINPFLKHRRLAQECDLPVGSFCIYSEWEEEGSFERVGNSQEE